MSSYEHLDALVGRSVRFTVGPVAGRVGVVNGHTSDRQQLLVGLVPTLQTAGEPPRTITLAYHKLAASADDAVLRNDGASLADGGGAKHSLTARVSSESGSVVKRPVMK